MFTPIKKFEMILNEYCGTHKLYQVKIPDTTIRKNVYCTTMKVVIRFIDCCMEVRILAKSFDPCQEGRYIGECEFASINIPTQGNFSFWDYKLVVEIMDEQIVASSSGRLVYMLFLKYCKDFIKEYMPEYTKELQELGVEME